MKTKPFARVLHPLLGILFACSLATAAYAGGGGGEQAKAKTAPAAEEMKQAIALVEAEKFAEALPILREAEKKEPESADVHNYLGFALRNLDRYEESEKHYDIALRIDPEHLGANEYVGELYLKLGRLAEAEERLAVLDEACFFGCEEYDELKEAIEEYKAQNPSS